MPRKHNPKFISQHISPKRPSQKSPSPTSVSGQPLSPLIELPSTPSSPQTLRPIPDDHSIQWIYQGRRPHPFITEISSTTGAEVTKHNAFEVDGLVVDFYVHADAYAHTIRLQLSSTDIKTIKNIR